MNWTEYWKHVVSEFFDTSLKILMVTGVLWVLGWLNDTTSINVVTVLLFCGLMATLGRVVFAFIDPIIYYWWNKLFD